MIHALTSSLDPMLQPFAKPSFVKPAFGGAAPNGLGRSFDKMMALPCWAGDLIRLGAHSGMGALGIYVGLTHRNGWGTLGWVIGLLSSFAALLDICALLGHMFLDPQ